MKLSEIDILAAEDRELILSSFNNTKTEYPANKTVHKLFEEQAERTPDNIAVICEDKQLTYRELNEQSNQLAGTLREKGVKPDSIVGIMAKRSVEMIIGIMAILKAGGAYLPIDAGLSGKRVKYCLRSSTSPLLVQLLAILLTDDNCETFNKGW